MRCRGVMAMSMLLGLLGSSVAAAATSPSVVVQQFIDAHLKGRFAEAQSVLVGQANLHASVFSNWLFAPGGASGGGATADVFLSRKFAQSFRYKIIGTSRTGDNQAQVTVRRVSPNLVHMYTWALAPKRGAAPYELIEAIDTYLTKVNFPIEQSDMQVTLVQEADAWYISAIYDERFAQMQQQWVATTPVASQQTAAPPQAAQPQAVNPNAPPPPIATTDSGRQMADAQFNATLQSFNRTYQTPAQQPVQTPAQQPATKTQEKKPSFFSKLFSMDRQTGPELNNASLKMSFDNIRNAMALYAIENDQGVPKTGEIYNWQSLHQLVSHYSKKPFPATETAAGLNFVRYRDYGIDDYSLILEIREPQDGVKNIEVTPYGVERAAATIKK